MSQFATAVFVSYMYLPDTVLVALNDELFPVVIWVMYIHTYINGIRAIRTNKIVLV